MAKKQIGNKMDRGTLMLAVLSTGDHHKYTPVQLQKVFFLVDNLVGNKIGGPYFKFIPYHYGPFDKSIYHELEELSKMDFVVVSNNPLNSLKKYSLTEKGIAEGKNTFNKLGKKEREYIEKLSDYVRRLSFSQLVSSIYKAFPEMKKNSIFLD